MCRHRGRCGWAMIPPVCLFHVLLSLVIARPASSCCAGSHRVRKEWTRLFLSHDGDDFDWIRTGSMASHRRSASASCPVIWHWRSPRCTCSPRRVVAMVVVACVIAQTDWLRAGRAVVSQGACCTRSRQRKSRRSRCPGHRARGLHLGRVRSLSAAFTQRSLRSRRRGLAPLRIHQLRERVVEIHARAAPRRDARSRFNKDMTLAGADVPVLRACIAAERGSRSDRRGRASDAHCGRRSAGRRRPPRPGRRSRRGSGAAPGRQRARRRSR